MKANGVNASEERSARVIPGGLDFDGPLAFPVTPFFGDGSLDIETYRRHVRWLLGYEPPALFVACGTGEFSSLDVEEVAALVDAAVDEAGPGVPVYAGAGHGLALAKRFAQAAQEAGAHGLLVLPPYLTRGEQEGLENYYRGIAAATSLPLVLYQRDTAVFEPATVASLATVANIVGFKDGLGEIERVQRIVGTVGGDLSYFNGMPTAETFQAAYTAMGVPHYSSAVFNFVPEISWAFYRATLDGDASVLERLLKDFFIPFAELRNRVRGYAVSLVKAGVTLRWGSVGPVRAPLVDARDEHVAELGRIVESVGNLVGNGTQSVGDG